VLVCRREGDNVQATYAPAMSVPLVARRRGVARNQLFRWRELYTEGALSAVGAGEAVEPAFEYQVLQSQVRAPRPAHP